MALHCNITNKHLILSPLSSSSSSSYFKFPKFIRFYFLSPNKLKTSFFVRSVSTSNHQNQDSDSNSEEPKISKKLSEKSSWEAKDSEGNDYLYRLGKESDNMNIAVGARAGVIDDLFTGKFLGRDSDIVFDYRQKATRSFEYLQGDYYIAPAFMCATL